MAPGDALASAARVPVPVIPSTVVVSDTHRRAVERRALDRIRAARRALDASEEVDLEDVLGLWNPDAPFQAGRRAVQSYRREPSPRRFAALIPCVGDAATILGHVRAARGDLGIDAVRTDYRTARDRYTTTTGRLEFRLATPVADLFPTVHTAVDALERAGTQRSVARRRVAGLSGARTAMLATTVASVELLRFETTNAEGYLATTLDPAAPGREATIVELADAHLSALATIDGPPRPGGRRLPVAIRRSLAGLQSRRARLLAAEPTALDPMDRVDLLLDALEVRGQLEAFAAAGEATYVRAPEPGDRPQRVPAEKRRAVDRLESLAGSSALQRRLGRRGAALVAQGDRVDADDATESLSTSHFFYVAGRAFAALSLRRGDRVAQALETGAD